MSNQIILKKSSVTTKVPVAGDLVYGELALNYADGKLYYKDSSNAIKSFTNDATAVTLTGTQTLTNKTLTSPTINSATANNLILTGTLTAGGGVGTNNQVLKSTGTGVTWVDHSIQALSDVQIASKTTQDVLTWNGSYWVASAPNTVVVSALFSSTATDFGYVYDAVTLTEDIGLITSAVTTYYDLAILSFTGIISLNNLDQSVKSDYLGYSIIFGF
jgi:hypothetical protein